MMKSTKLELAEIGNCIEQSQKCWRLSVLYWGMVATIISSVVIAYIQGWNRVPMMLPLGVILFLCNGCLMNARERFTDPNIAVHFRKIVSE